MTKQPTQPRLTLEQKDLYLDEEGNYCPYCKSSNIRGDFIKSSCKVEVWRCVCCDDCHQTWTETYELSGVY